MFATGQALPVTWEHWPGLNGEQFPSRLLLPQSSDPELEALQTFDCCVPILFLEFGVA